MSDTPNTSADETRGRLLEVATKLFSANGYGVTTVNQIVKAADVSKGALYHHYASKDELLYDIYRPVLSWQRERLASVLDSDLSVREKVHEAACDVIVTSIRNLDAVTVFFQSMHLLDAPSQAAVRRERRKYHEAFRGLIEEGQAQGQIRRDIQADLVVHYFFGSVHHLTYWYHADGGLSPQAIGDAFADLLVDGIFV